MNTYIRKNDDGQLVFDYDYLDMAGRANFLKDMKDWAENDMGSTPVNWEERSTEYEGRLLAEEYVDILDSQLYSDDGDVKMDPATRDMIIDAYVNEWRNLRTQYELEQIMTAQEIAEEYGIEAVTVYKNIERENIRARKSGGTWLIRRADAEARWGKKD